MRRVIQRTVTTTKIISLTITHSDEEVEYLLTTADELDVASQPVETVLRDVESNVDHAPADQTLPDASELAAFGEETDA